MIKLFNSNNQEKIDNTAAVVNSDVRQCEITAVTTSGLG